MHGFHQLCKTGVLAHHIVLITHIDLLHGIHDPLDNPNCWLNKLFAVMKVHNALKHVAEVMIEKIEKKKKNIRRGMFGNRLKQAQPVAVLNVAPLWLDGLAEYAASCN